MSWKIVLGNLHGIFECFDVATHAKGVIFCSVDVGVICN